MSRAKLVADCIVGLCKRLAGGIVLEHIRARPELNVREQTPAISPAPADFQKCRFAQIALDSEIGGLNARHLDVRIDAKRDQLTVVAAGNVGAADCLRKGGNRNVAVDAEPEIALCRIPGIGCVAVNPRGTGSAAGLKVRRNGGVEPGCQTRRNDCSFHYRDGCNRYRILPE